MSSIDPVLGAKLIYIFGIINVLLFFMIASTCRCAIGMKFVNDMLKKPWYKWLFDHHCWYWKLFFLSVIIHATLAFLVFGIPF